MTRTTIKVTFAFGVLILYMVIRMNAPKEEHVNIYLSEITMFLYFILLEIIIINNNKE